MEIYISDWIHKFHNKTGLDAKANSEIYKSKRVCSVGSWRWGGGYGGGEGWGLGMKGRGV